MGAQSKMCVYAVILNPSRDRKLVHFYWRQSCVQLHVLYLSKTLLSPS